MKKDSLISFRVSKDLHESLALVAKKDRRSLSSTIEIALTNYLKERKVSKNIEKEKRQFPRKALSIPAVIKQKENGQMGIGTVSEISLGGVTVLIHKDFKHQIPIDSQGLKFELVFNLPVENKPVNLSCESSRVVDAENSFQIGAFFVDADFKSYKALQAYLV